MEDHDETQPSFDDGALKISYKPEELSSEQLARIRRIVGEDTRLVRAVYSDLLHSGHFGEGVLVQTSDDFISIDSDDKVLYRVPLEAVVAISCRDLVGNGILEVQGVEGERTELLRYSRTLTDPFHELTTNLNREFGLGDKEQEEQQEEVAKRAAPAEERASSRCPKCGHPLRYPTDPCPYCTNKRKVLWRLVGYLFRHKRLLVLGTLTSLAVVAINVSPPILVRMLIDKALAPAEPIPDDVRMMRVYLIVGLFLALILVRMVVQYVRIRAMGQLAAEVVMDLRRDLFRSLQRLSLSYYDTTHTGRIMSRVLSDTRNIQGFVVGGLQQVGMHTLMVIVIPVIMIQQHWALALVALAPIPFAAYLGKVFSNRYKAAFRTLKRRMATLSAAVSDTVSGIQVVKSFSQEDRETTRFDEKTAGIYDAQLSAASTRALFNPSVMFIMTFGTLLVWLLGGRWVLLGAGLTTGMLVQFISYMNQLRAPVQQLIQLTETFQQSATSAERVFNIMDMPSEVGDREGAKPIENVKGHLEFRNVSFKYNNGERVLRNVSFEIKPGEMLGLVGQTGSGKSTLASLVCRFYDPTEGAVLLDGHDLRDITVRSLRDRIGMVLQSTFLFAGTIRENLVYGNPEATEREIVEAAKAANAHDFIMQLPDAYDSEVGERGSGLSGGEKQRIAIARAILKDPDILILDEATSAVDTATEQAIQGAMDRLIQGRTTIAIAHRLSTLRNADKLLVLEQGEILEQGTHEELINANGEYSKLCRIQAEFAEHVAHHQPATDA